MKHIPDNYLVEWYIGVAKRRGWDEVVRLLKQYPKDEKRMASPKNLKDYANRFCYSHEYIGKK